MNFIAENFLAIFTVSLTHEHLLEHLQTRGPIR